MMRHTLLTWAALLTASTIALGQPAPKVYLGLTPAEPAAGVVGIVIDDVDPEGPAGKAGLRPADRIVKVNDQAVANADAFLAELAKHKPGDKIALGIVRNGQEQKLEVTLGERPGPERVPPPGESSRPAATAYLGIFMEDLTPPLRARLGVSAEQGIVVADVSPNSPAAKAGLRAGDVITHAGGKPLTSRQQLAATIQEIGPGKELALKVARRQEVKDVVATLAEPPAESPRSRVPPVEIPRVGEGASRLQLLERRIEELERRLQELEKKIK